MTPSCELKLTPTRRTRSLFLSRSLIPPLLLREKNPNPRIQNWLCRRIKSRNCCVGQTHGRKTENGKSRFRFPFSFFESRESRARPGRPDLHTRAPSLFPSLFCASTVTFLCVQWSQIDRRTDRIPFFESDCPGSFRRRIKTRNRRVTHGRTT